MSILTIGITFYNSETFLKETLESILPILDINEVQLILVNDGSTDSSEQVIRDSIGGYEHKVKIINQLNYGTAFSRNRIISESQSEWIFFLDADDLVVPETMLKILSYLASCQTNVIRCGWSNVGENIYQDLGAIKTAQIRLDDKIKMDLFQKRGFWSYFYKKEFLERKAINFFPSFAQAGCSYIFDDFYFLAHLLSKSDEISECLDIVYLYRNRKEGTDLKYRNQIAFEGRVWSSFIKNNRGLCAESSFLRKVLITRFINIRRIQRKYRLPISGKFRIEEIIWLIRMEKSFRWVLRFGYEIVIGSLALISTIMITFKNGTKSFNE